MGLFRRPCIQNASARGIQAAVQAKNLDAGVHRNSDGKGHVTNAPENRLVTASRILLACLLRECWVLKHYLCTLRPRCTDFVHTQTTHEVKRTSSIQTSGLLRKGHDTSRSVHCRQRAHR